MTGGTTLAYRGLLHKSRIVPSGVSLRPSRSSSTKNKTTNESESKVDFSTVASSDLHVEAYDRLP